MMTHRRKAPCAVNRWDEAFVCRSMCTAYSGLAMVVEVFINRLLRKSASGVLAALRGSTRRTNFWRSSTVGAFPFARIHSRGERPTRSAVCTSSPRRLLRPCWTAFLNGLRWLLNGSSSIQTLRACSGQVVCQHPVNHAGLGRRPLRMVWPLNCDLGPYRNV